MKKAPTCAGVFLVLFAGVASGQQTLLLRQPDVSAEHLVFVYAGDLWIAGRDGSSPRRLTSSPVEENSPAFSPDGSMVAYAADHENNTDVYVISVAGGQPRRLTWHPGDDVPTGWTADGSAVTLVSARETDHGRSGQLYHVALSGGLPQKQMEARVYRGVYDEQGGRFAYIAFGSGYNGLFGGGSGWKGYRGGTTPAIQVMDLDAQTVRTIPGAGVTNFNPMWSGDDIYFISDRENEIFNIYRYASDGSIERVTSESTWDVRAAGIHGDAIVYEAGGRIKEIDLGSGSVSEIVISVDPDLPQLRTQWKSAAGTIQHAHISPTGKRAIVTARGEVFTVPVEDGSTRNISNSASVREYTAIWSPAGDRVAYIADGLSGQSLVVIDQIGTGEASEYELGPYFYELMGWTNGDVSRIVFQDNHLSLYAIELDDGEIAKISTGARREAVEATLSSDGRWIAFTEERPNYQRALKLHRFDTGDTFTITDGDADVASPAFSRDGAYLYFAASTNSGPIQVGLNMTSQERPYRAGLYAIVLAADGASPLLPESGDESGVEPENGDDESESEEAEASETRIDIDGIGQRIVALQVAERNYGNLAVADDGNLYYVQSVQPGTSNEPPGDDADEGNVLVRFDFEEKEAKSLLTGVEAFALSEDGKHMLIAKVDNSLAVAEVADEIKPEPLNLDGVRVRVDPREEWGLIFDEAWRMEKEFFYDPNMHGLDWDAIYERYRPLVEHVGRREDLNALMVEMIAEMQVGHNRVGGGDVHRESGTNTGLLGANFRIENGRYRIARVYSGESWNPFIAAPLATPGNEAREGEYILAVDGRGNQSQPSEAIEVRVP